jgi:hypothetical protein
VALLVMKYVLFGKNCLGFVMAPGRTFAEFVAKKVTGDGFVGDGFVEKSNRGRVC